MNISFTNFILQIGAKGMNSFKEIRLSNLRLISFPIWFLDWTIGLALSILHFSVIKRGLNWKSSQKAILHPYGLPLTLILPYLKIDKRFHSKSLHGVQWWSNRGEFTNAMFSNIRSQLPIHIGVSKTTVCCMIARTDMFFRKKNPELYK